MKKKLLSTLVVLVAVIAQAWMATSARAATNYGISIGSVAITSDNYQNLAGIVPAGIVTFDPQTATLTLNNVVFNMVGNGISVNSSYFSRIKIKLMGSNYIAGLYWGLQVNTGVTLVIEGPGSLTVSASTNGFPTVAVYNDSYLTSLDTSFTAYSITGYNSPSGSNPERSLTVINSTVDITTKMQGITYLTNVYSRFEDTNVGFQNGKVVNLSTGAEVSGFKIMATPEGDFDSNGKLNLYDAQYLVDYQLGYQMDDDPTRMDLTRDGDINVADITMLYNYIGGTRSSRTYDFIMMHELVGNSYTFGNLDREIMYSGSSITQKWVWTNLFLGDIVDMNSSHFHCSSSNSAVVSASVVTAALEGNLSTKAFQLTIRKTGNATITFKYDDGTGNSIEARATYFVYGPNDVLASNDKIYGANLNGSTVESFNLNMKSNVPVGTTMRLTIDKDATYSYDMDTRKARMNCTSWNVSGNGNVTLTKTGDGYVEVFVGGAGEFTVTAFDPRGAERSATFVAKDVYTYDSHSVYKNGEAIFNVPEAKTSQIFGRASAVTIEKMVLRQSSSTDVWTIVNHYKPNQDGESAIGKIEHGSSYGIWTYTIPVCAQVYRNGVLYYESEDSYFTDIALYGLEDVTVVGYKYDPELEFQGHGYQSSEWTDLDDEASMRLSMFYAVLNTSTGSKKEVINPYGFDNESRLTNVTYDDSTGDILLYGYWKRRRSTSSWSHTTYCWARDWLFIRFDNDANRALEDYMRDQNEHWTYQPYALAVAKNTPIGVAGIRYYEPWDYGFVLDDPEFFFSGGPEGISTTSDARMDYLMSDFSDQDGGNGIDLEGTSTSVYSQSKHFGGITSSWYNGSLYGWMSNKVYKFADDFNSYDVYITYEDLGSITQLKVVHNTFGVSDVEELFVLASKDWNSKVLHSMFGDVDIANPSLIGFDFK